MLSDQECLALVLGSEARAGQLLAAVGALPELAELSAAALQQQAGVPPAAAARLVAAFGLARRLVAARFAPGQAMRSAGEVGSLVRELCRGLQREAFFAFYLDARHRLLRSHQVSVGSLTAAPVHPREVFGPALREAAAAVLVAHNHPSGDARPSAEDRRVTARLRETGDLLGVPLLDHVVVGAERCFSFHDERYRELG